MNEFTNLLNEYEKGNGRLFAYTTANEYRDNVLSSLDEAGLTFLVKDEAGAKNTVYFGDANAIENLRILLALELGFAGVDTDSIVKSMLGNKENVECIGLYNSEDDLNRNTGVSVRRAG